MKKILLGFGAVTALVAPAAIAVSCEIKDYDPEKNWEETVTYTATGNVTNDYKALQDLVNAKAQSLNDEMGRRWQVHIAVNHNNPSGVVRTWTGSVASTEFGRADLAVKNDINDKLNEYRRWAEFADGNYESEFIEPDRAKAKTMFEQEVEFARNQTHVSHIKITIWNRRGGEKMVYDQPRTDLRVLENIFDSLPNIETVYP